MPITPNETTAELQAMEQDAMEELWKKWASLWEEEEVKAREWQEADMSEQKEALAFAKAICQVQEKQELQGMLDINLSF